MLFAAFLALSMLQDPAPTYTMRYYTPGAATPVSEWAVTTPLLCDQTVIVGNSINPTTAAFDLETATNCTINIRESLAPLPRSVVGTNYEATVVECKNDLCLESNRAPFCVGVPIQFENAQNCESAIAQGEFAIWYYCFLLRLCGF